MRSAAQNLRTAIAMAVDGKSRASLFRVLCSRFRSSSSPPPVLESRVALFRGFCSPFYFLPLPVLQLSDRTTADGGGAAPDVITLPPHLPPPCDQNAAGAPPWLEELDHNVLQSDFKVGDCRLWADGLCLGLGLVKYSDPANNSELISLADYCVQQISQIQDSQYKLVKIVEAARVAVAGLKIWITLELSNQDGQLIKYRFEVWVRPRLKLRELLSWRPVD